MISNSRGLRYLAIAGSVVLALVACEEITGPSSDPVIGNPRYAMSDGTNGGAAGFYFMPPTVVTPKPKGTFDASLLSQITVKICELTPGPTPACGPEISSFTSATSPMIRGTGDYAIKWDTKRLGLSTSKYYRIRVLVNVPDSGNILLGFADVDIVASSKEAKTVIPGYIPLQNGAILDIHFRIETQYTLGIVIDPRGGIVNLGSTRDFTATVTGLHGAVNPGSAAWSTTDTTIAKVSPAVGTTATVTGRALGTTWLKAASGGIVDSVQITVSANGPLARNDSIDAVAGVVLNGNLLSDNGSGVDSVGIPAATVISFGGGSLPGNSQSFTLDSAVNLAGGKLAVNANGTFSLTKPRQAGRYTFLYRISNSSGTSDATVTLKVAPSTAYQLIRVGVDTATGAPAGQRTIQVKVVDSLGNAIAGDSVSWSVLSGGGSVGAPSSLTDSTGVASIVWTYGTTAGCQDVQGSRAGFVGSPVIFTSNVTSGSAGKLAVSQQPSATASSGTAFAQQPTVQLKDQYGNAVAQSGVTVTAAINSGGGTIGGTLTANTNASGVATFTNLKITGTIGKRTLIFSAPSLTSVVSDSIQVTAGTASRIDKNSVDSLAGAPQSQRTLKVKVSDASGNGIAGQSISWSVLTGGGSVDSAASVTDSLGVASMGWTLGTGTGWQTAQAARAGLTNSPLTFSANVTAGAPDSLSIAIQPSTSATSGVVFGTQPQIQLKDIFGNNAPYSGRSVTVALNSGGGTLGGTVTDTTNASGAVTFTNLKISGAPGKKTLIFTSPSLKSAISDSIQINAGAASKIEKNSTDSTSVAVGGTETLKVKVTDATGNPIYGDSVSWSVTSGGGNVASPKSATDSAGIASIVWTLGTAPGWQNAQATRAGLTGSPITFSVNATTGSAAQLRIQQQPSDSATSGAVLTRQPIVRVTDQYGNAVSGSGRTVTVALNGAGTLGGTASDSTDASGVVTFTNLKITSAAGKRTLTFSSASLTDAVSDSINIEAAGAGAMTKVLGDDSTRTVGKNHSVAVHLSDANGDNAPGVTVRWKVLTGAGSIDSVTTTDSNGRATATWVLGTTLGDQTAEAKADGYANSPDTFTVHTVADSAYRVTLVTEPSTPDTSGTFFKTQPVVRLKDQYGNIVKKSGVEIGIAIATGTGSFMTPSNTATTDSVGVATFANVGLTGAEGDFRLNFTSTGLVSDSTQTIHLVNASTRGWVGVTSTDWAVAGNWNPANLPDSASDITVPASAPNMPLLDQSRVVTSLTLASGGTLGLQNLSLRVKGDVASSGVISNGTILFAETGHQFSGNVPTVLVTGSAKVNGSAVASGPVTVTGNLTVKDAALSIALQ